MKTDNTAEDLIAKYKLAPRVFGGSYGLHYASPEMYTNKEMFGDEKPRCYIGSLYAMLRGNEKFWFHKFPVDCIITFVQGQTTTFYVIDEKTQKMTSHELNHENFTLVIPRGHWYGGEIKDAVPEDFSLMTVANVPGIWNEDAIFPEPNELVKICPDERDVIDRLTH